MTPKIDTIHRQRQRELILALLASYGIPQTGMADMDNGELLRELEKTLTTLAEKIGLYFYNDL